MITKYCKTREEWLNKMKDGLQPLFVKNGYNYPDKIRLSVGFPANSRGGHAVGQCWTPTLSKDGTHEIFISPEIDDPVTVAAIETHELIHTIVGVENRHNKIFGKCARSMGLEGKLTQSNAGPILTTEIQNIINRLCGLYPHATLQRPPAKQGTRMIKCVCPDCGYTVRTTSKWIDKGYPLCPDMHEMTIEGFGDPGKEG